MSLRSIKVALGLALIAAIPSVKAVAAQTFPAGGLLDVPWVGQVYIRTGSDPACPEANQCPAGLYGWEDCFPASLAMVMAAPANHLNVFPITPEGDRCNPGEEVARVRMVNDRVQQYPCNGGISGFDKNGNTPNIATRNIQYFVNGHPYCRTGVESVGDIEHAVVNMCLPIVALVLVRQSNRTQSAADWISCLSCFNSDSVNHWIVIIGVFDGKTWYRNPLPSHDPGQGPKIAAVDKNLMWSTMSYFKPSTSRAVGNAAGTCDDNFSCGSGGGAGGGAAGGGSGGGPVYVQDHVEVYMTTTCPDKNVQLFWDTGTSLFPKFKSKNSTSRYLQREGWQRLMFDLSGRDSYKGTLKAMRVDPSTSPGCVVGFSALRISDGDGHYGLTREFYQYSGQSRAMGYCRYWQSFNTTDMGLLSSWMHTSLNSDPYIFENDMDLDIGR